MGSKSKQKVRGLNIPVTNPNINNKRELGFLPVSTVNDKRMLLSFRYFKCNCVANKEFNNCYQNTTHYSTWLTLAMKRLSEITTMTLGELNNSGRSLRFHSVENENLNKLKSVLLNLGLDVEFIFNQSESNDYYEISLGAANGRIFGYLIENIFFVLLLDPNHLIYPCVAKGATQDLLFKRYNPWEEIV